MRGISRFAFSHIFYNNTGNDWDKSRLVASNISSHFPNWSVTGLLSTKWDKLRKVNWLWHEPGIRRMWPKTFSQMHGKINSQLTLSIYSVDSRVALELSADEAFIRMAISCSAEAQNQQPTGNTELRSVWSAGIRMMASIWCSHTCKVYTVYIYIYSGRIPNGSEHPYALLPSKGKALWSVLFEGCRALLSCISVWNSLGKGMMDKMLPWQRCACLQHSALQQLLQINISSYCYYFIQILFNCVLFTNKLFQIKRVTIQS